MGVLVVAAMEVRTCGCHKAVLLAQGKALGAVLRAVAGVVHLYAVHCALCRQLPQQGHTFVHRGVGKHHRAAAGFSGSQHLPHRQILRRVQYDAPGIPPEQLVVGLAVDAAIGQAQQFQRLHQPAFEQHSAGLGGLPRKVGGKLRVQLLQLLCALQSAGVAANVNLVKFSLVNLCLSIGFLVWCILAYKIMPDHPIAEAKEEALHAGEQKVALTKNQELITYFSFVLAVVGMILQSKIGDAGYAITGLAVGVILISGVMDFNEIRNSISAPIILMSAGVIGIADALGNTGLTSLVGETVAKMLGTNVNPFVLIFAFCILTSLLATLTGSTIGTVYVFAPMAIATCVNLGLDPTAAAAAIVVSGWCGHFLPIDGMPAMIMGAGDYKITEFWKFTIPQYFIRLLALTVGAVLIFPMK